MRSVLQVADEPPDPEVQFAQALTGLERILHLSIGLRVSSSLRRIALAGRLVVVTSLSRGAGWARLTGGGFTVSRERPMDAALDETRPFASLLDDAALTAALAVVRGSEQDGRAATRLMVGILADERGMYSRLAEWGPLVEPMLYTIGTRLATVLGATKAEVREACIERRPSADHLVRSYRNLAFTMGRAALMATDAAQPWLTVLAEGGVWTNGTPSLPLIRQRNVWSVLIGARVASRFGISAVDGYFEALARSRRPLEALDALVALTAISLRHPCARADISTRLDVELNQMSMRMGTLPDNVALAYMEFKRAVDPAPSSGLLPFSRFADGFGTDRDGRMRAFRYLREAVEAPAWKFIPAAGEAEPGSNRLVIETFMRSSEADAEERKARRLGIPAYS